jgi:hypothetical protein
MKKIGVVHLVRKSNGFDPFRKFVESYRRGCAGIENELVLLFKGFGSSRETEEYTNIVDFPTRSLFVRDFGYDIRAYLIAAKTFDFDFFCFLNSFSVILDKDWLLKMADHAARKDVALVGATGSYMSHLTFLLGDPEFGTFLPIGSRRISLPGFAGRALRSAMVKHYEQLFEPFPNPHIRTNAFFVSRELLGSIPHGILLRKKHAHLFESGKEGLTRQVFRRNMKALVVGRDGKAYEWERWPDSNTLLQGDQENLLVADNVTRKYSEGDLATRVTLSRRAWGAAARPREGKAGEDGRA